MKRSELQKQLFRLFEEDGREGLIIRRGATELNRNTEGGE